MSSPMKPNQPSSKIPTVKPTPVIPATDPSDGSGAAGVATEPKERTSSSLPAHSTEDVSDPSEVEGSDKSIEESFASGGASSRSGPSTSSISSSWQPAPCSTSALDSVTPETPSTSTTTENTELDIFGRTIQECFGRNINCPEYNPDKILRVRRESWLPQHYELYKNCYEDSLENYNDPEIFSIGTNFTIHINAFCEKVGRDGFGENIPRYAFFFRILRLMHHVQEIAKEDEKDLKQQCEDNPQDEEQMKKLKEVQKFLNLLSLEITRGVQATRVFVCKEPEIDSSCATQSEVSDIPRDSSHCKGSAARSDDTQQGSVQLSEFSSTGEYSSDRSSKGPPPKPTRRQLDVASSIPEGELADPDAQNRRSSFAQSDTSSKDAPSLSEDSSRRESVASTASKHSSIDEGSRSRLQSEDSFSKIDSPRKSKRPGPISGLEPSPTKRYQRVQSSYDSQSSVDYEEQQDVIQSLPSARLEDNISSPSVQAADSPQIPFNISVDEESIPDALSTEPMSPGSASESMSPDSVSEQP